MAIILSYMNHIHSVCGRRLADIRKAQGLSQRDLALKTGISNRMIAYYEAQTDRPPAAQLPLLAKALNVTTDELLGNKPLSVTPPKNSRLWKRLQAVDSLPPKAQKQVVELVELLADSIYSVNYVLRPEREKCYFVTRYFHKGKRN
jgi:transcriptional regulator with XRE-family HTH domain